MLFYYSQLLHFEHLTKYEDMNQNQYPLQQTKVVLDFRTTT